jgi:hypothetical protein
MRNLKVAIGAVGAVMLLGAGVARASPLSTTVTFTPIGDGPNFEWTAGRVGTFSSIDPGGGADVLVSASDNQGLSITNVPAIMEASGDFFGVNTSPIPQFFDFGVGFIYAGTTPLVVGTNTINPGGDLGGIGFNTAGSAGFDSEILFGGNGVNYLLPEGDFGRIADGSLDVNPGPTIQLDQGNRPTLTAGEGQLSGTWTFNAIPEPSSWALLVLGFGLGGSLLRRHKVVAAN